MSKHVNVAIVFVRTQEDAENLVIELGLKAVAIGKCKNRDLYFAAVQIRVSFRDFKHMAETLSCWTLVCDETVKLAFGMDTGETLADRVTRKANEWISTIINL